MARLWVCGADREGPEACLCHLTVVEGIHSLIHIDSDRGHMQMFKKLAEVIEFAEDN